MKQILAQENGKQAQHKQEEPEVESFSLNTELQIDQPRFEQALQVFIEQLKQQDKVTLAAVLGAVRFIYGWSLKPLIYLTLAPVLALTVFVATRPELSKVLGLAFDCGALELIAELVGRLGGKDVCIIGSGDNHAAFALAFLSAFFSAFSGAAACALLALLVSRSGGDMIRRVPSVRRILNADTQSLITCVGGITAGLPVPRRAS